MRLPCILTFCTYYQPRAKYNMYHQGGYHGESISALLFKLWPY